MKISNNKHFCTNSTFKKNDYKTKQCVYIALINIGVWISREIVYICFEKPIKRKSKLITSHSVKLFCSSFDKLSDDPYRIYHTTCYNCVCIIMLYCQWFKLDTTYYNIKYARMLHQCSYNMHITMFCHTWCYTNTQYKLI